MRSVLRLCASRISSTATVNWGVPTNSQIRDAIINDKMTKLNEIEVLGPIILNNQSAIYKGKSADLPFDVAIKKFRLTQDQTVETVSRAYDSLRSMYSLTERDPALASPRPVQIIPEQAIIISEWIAGPTLSAEMKSATPERQLRLVHMAGCWLGRFTRIQRPSMKPLRTIEMLESIEWSNIPDNLVKYRDLLITTAEHAAREPVAWRLNFGDFKGENLILADERLHGIDTQMEEEGPETIDAAHFLNDAVLRRRIRFLIGSTSDWGAAIEDAFCEGHETNECMVLPRYPLLWTQLHSALRMRRDFVKWSRPPVSWITQRVLDRLVALRFAQLKEAST